MVGDMHAGEVIALLLMFLIAPLAIGEEGASIAEKAARTLSENTLTTVALERAADDEETVPEFDFLPPLGLDDAMRLVGKCIYFLDGSDKSFLDYKKQRVTEALNAATEYMKILDERHSSLERYRWYFVGKQKVSRDGVDEDFFPVEPPLQRVSAISFVADRGNVTIRRMTVSDAEGNETKFTVERTVRMGLPRKEVCFLYYQQTVSKITLYYSTNEKEVGPRLRVYCGVTPMPEYAKEVIYFLTRAKKDLAQNDLNQAGDNMRKAWRRMLQIKRSWFKD